MNLRDKAVLEKLLRDLCSSQDTVTHYNKCGTDYYQQLSQAIRERSVIKRRIVALVESMVAP